MIDSSTLAYVAFALAVGLTTRYLLSEASSGRSTDSSNDASPETLLARVQLVLPDVDREIILQDLRQTRDAEQTSQRLLARITEGSLAGPKAGADSLLSRYSVESSAKAPETTTGWQSTREAREAQLRAQRQAMVIKARQKFLETENM